MKTNYSFNLNQLLALGTVMMLAPSLRLIPSQAVALAGRGAWLSAIAAIPVLLLYLLFICRFMGLRQEGEGLAELTLRCAGDKVGKIILAVLSLWLLLYGGFSLRAGANRFITTIYPYSKPAVFAIIMGLMSLLAALGSARTIVRVAKLVLPLVLSVLLLILAFALFSIDSSNLLPITIYDAVPVFKGSIPVIDVLAVIILSMCFFSGFTPNAPGQFRALVIWLLLMCLLITLLCLAVIGSFGAELTARLTRPFFSLVRNLVFFHTVERVEALVVALWMFPNLLLVALMLYSAQHCLRLILGVKKPEYRGEKLLDMSRRRWVIPLCGMAAIIAGILIGPEPVSLLFWSETLIPLINLIVAFALIPFIYIVGKIRKAL